MLGSLLASDNIDVFFDMLNGSNVLNGAGVLHLVNQDGQFLIRSPQMIVQKEINSIFDGPYWSGEDESKRRAPLCRISRAFSLPFGTTAIPISFCWNPG